MSNSITIPLPGNPEDDPVLADEGYPSTIELQRIARWEIHNGEDLMALMDYVHERWAYQAFGWHRGKVLRVRYPKATYFSPGDRERSRVRTYHISTAGWSGNESIITALRENWMFWTLCWYQGRVGGHYIFQVPEKFS